MNIVELVDERKFEVQSCTHCHNDTIEYNHADEHWICGACYSTYVIFNEEIAK
jgi:ribosomal protein S27AE